LDQEHIPTGMELWPAADPSVWDIVSGYLKQCDYYVLIIGGRYGTIAPETGISYTEREYDLAHQNEVPVLAFLHAAPAGLPLEKSEMEQVGRDKLKAFVEKVRSRHTVKEWSNADQLQYLVSNALRHAIKHVPRDGWVRANLQLDPKVYKELNDLRTANEQLVVALSQVEAAPPASAEDFAGLSSPFTVTFDLTVEKRKYSSSGSYTTEQAEVRRIEEPTSFGHVFERIGFGALGSIDAVGVQNEMEAAFHEILQDRMAEKEPGWFVGQLRVHRHCVRQIIIQFVGLGIFEETDKKRGNAWRLSKHGRTTLVQLVAQPADERVE
jgi:hypothetical protein